MSINHLSIQNWPEEDYNKNERFSRLSRFFAEKYQKIPEFLISIPGRVNIIGEHIDYCGYAVFPMAIQQDCLLSASKNPSKINITNILQNEYLDFSVDSNNYYIDHSNPHWYNYILCGHKGIMDELKKNELNNSPGMNVAIDSIIPPSSGLSSSSALVCASALATKFIVSETSLAINLSDIARICATSERYIGTQGGGMDQAIELLAEKGYAKLIEFKPKLKLTSVKLPETANFFVSHCGASCTKSATNNYNERVFAVRTSAAIIANKFGLSLDSKKHMSLSDVQEKLSKSLAEMMDIVKNTFDSNRNYSASEIASELKLPSINYLLNLISDGSEESKEKFKQVIESNKIGFPLQNRAFHVYSEANRVLQTVSVCESDLSEDIKLNELGRLMNESHESCRDIYECSCSELDQLVEMALSSGASGARLTGAGWGGCIISLVGEKESNDFEKKMSTKAKFTFKTKPGPGASLFM